MNKRLDIKPGDKFNYLTVIKETDPQISPSGWTMPRYECVCKCGNTTNATGSALIKGHKKSCGCLRHRPSPNRINVVPGDKFGALTVVKEIEKTRSGARRMECVCECGKTVNVILTHLTSGHTISCGCRTYKDIRNEKLEKAVRPVIDEVFVDNRNAKVLCECPICGHKYYAVLSELEHRVCRKCSGIEAAKRMEETELKEGTCLCRLTKKVQKNSTTGVRGVMPHYGKYEAYIYLARKRHYLGLYDTIEEAKKARSVAEEKIWGPVLERYGRELK